MTFTSILEHNIYKPIKNRENNSPTQVYEMSVPKIHSGKAIASIFTLLVIAAFLSATVQPALNASDKYWAKYEFHGYTKDKSKHFVAYVYVDLSDPRWPDEKITDVKIVKGHFDDTELAGIDTAVSMLIDYLIDIVADPENLPSNGVIQTKKYNTTVYEVYDTQTYLLKYARLGSEEEGNYIYEMKLIDTNVKPGWLGTTTTSEAQPPVQATSSSSESTLGVKTGQYVAYHLEFNLVNKKTGEKLKGSGDVKITLEVEEGYVGVQNAQTSNLNIEGLPKDATEGDFKTLVENFVGYYIPVWKDPKELPDDGVVEKDVGKLKATLAYDVKTGLLKNAYVAGENEEATGEVKITLIDTDVPSLKSAVGEEPAGAAGGGGFGGILTAAIGAVIAAAIAVVFTLIKKRRAKTATYGAYGPTYPPPPGTPPPPPG